MKDAPMSAEQIEDRIAELTQDLEASRASRHPDRAKDATALVNLIAFLRMRLACVAEEAA